MWNTCETQTSDKWHHSQYDNTLSDPNTFQLIHWNFSHCIRLEHHSRYRSDHCNKAKKDRQRKCCCCWTSESHPRDAAVSFCRRQCCEPENPFVLPILVALCVQHCQATAPQDLNTHTTVTLTTKTNKNTLLTLCIFKLNTHSYLNMTLTHKHRHKKLYNTCMNTNVNEMRQLNFLGEMPNLKNTTLEPSEQTADERAH